MNNEKKISLKKLYTKDDVLFLLKQFFNDETIDVNQLLNDTEIKTSETANKLKELAKEKGYLEFGISFSDLDNGKKYKTSAIKKGYPLNELIYVPLHDVLYMKYVYVPKEERQQKEIEELKIFKIYDKGKWAKIVREDDNWLM